MFANYMHAYAVHDYASMALVHSPAVALSRMSSMSLLKPLKPAKVFCIVC